MSQHTRPVRRALRTAGKAVVFFNEKGGVGKSSESAGATAVAAEPLDPQLPDELPSIIAVDLDPRATFTDELGVKDPDRGTADLLAVPDGEFVDPANIVNDMLLAPGADWPQNVRVIAATRTLANRETSPAPQAEYRLGRALAPLRERTDLIVMDTPARTAGTLFNAMMLMLEEDDTMAIPATVTKDGVLGLVEAMKSLIQFSLSTQRQLPKILVTASAVPTKFSELKPVDGEWRQELKAKVSSVEILHLNLLYTQLAAINRRLVKLDQDQQEQKSLLRFKPVRLLKTGLVFAGNREWARTACMPATSMPKTAEALALLAGYREVVRFARTGQGRFVDLDAAAAAA